MGFQPFVLNTLLSYAIAAKLVTKQSVIGVNLSQ